MNVATNPQGLTSEVFGAYAPDKWSSNVHNLLRMKAKDALLELCRAASQGLEDALQGLSRGASDEVPNITNQKKVDAQWIYWIRDVGEREELKSFQRQLKLDASALLHLAPHDKHVALAVVARQDGLWIGVRLPAGATVDRRNLASKLDASWERDKALATLGQLPESVRVEVSEAATGAHGIDDEALANLGRLLSQPETSLWIGQSVTAEDAVSAGPGLADDVRRWLQIFVPVYRLSAWSRGNDHIDATRQIQEEKAQKRKQATSYKSGDEVRIIGGLFSGKVGVVESTDTKGQVKVRVGLMTVVVPGTDLLPRQ